MSRQVMQGAWSDHSATAESEFNGLIGHLYSESHRKFEALTGSVTLQTSLQDKGGNSAQRWVQQQQLLQRTRYVSGSDLPPL